ncbi:hypothetical protein HNP84_004354 [Thermocatellispora tengchongensis]|uniref:Trypsin-co-occurring domain-containing protein n=1 Tax=Thermocatellispora tengchongensis TaxID=1073253 RepID=A0A840P5K1_9ACTN|nr:hypothetical protein [Thermocatellispora tengchongensis]
MEKIDLELAVDVRHERGGEGGFKSWVVSLRGKGGSARQSTHKINPPLRLPGNPPISGGEDDIPEQ